MYVETVPNRNSRPAILLREGWREGGRVRKRTLANLTDWPAEKVDSLRRVLKGQRLVSPEEALHHRTLPPPRPRRRPARHDPAPGPGPAHRPQTLARTRPGPGHGRATAAPPRLEARHPPAMHTTTLAQELDLGDADEDALYEAMDWLLARQERIERRLAQRHLHEGAPVFADVSGSYGRTCPLMRFGYNRDGKRGKVVYTVLTAPGGCPVAVQAYPGNTADPNTVADQVMKLREHFALKRVVLVGDRGLLTQVQIDHPQAPSGARMGQRVAGGAGALPGRERGVTVVAVRRAAPGRVHQPGLPWRAPGRVLQPVAGRGAGAQARGAAHRHRGRARTHRTRGRPAHPHAARCGTARTQGGTGHRPAQDGQALRWEVHDGRLVYERDHARIDAEARLDGIYVLRTSEPAERLSPQDTVRTYKGLADVERWFRTLKGSTSGCAPSATARNAGSARICSSACSPATWNGTCAAPGRRCCSTARPWPTPAHPRPRRPGQAHRSRPAQKGIPAQRLAPSQPRYPARRTRDPLPQHLSGSRRPLGPGPVCADRADTDSAPRRTPHRNVPITGNSRKLKLLMPINQLNFVTPRELRASASPAEETAGDALQRMV